MSQRTVQGPEISPDAMRAYRAAKALHRDGGTPASVFGLLAAIVEDRTWERLLDNSDQPFRSFTTFVEAPEPGGLGTTREELRKLLELRHPHEDGALWSKRAPWLRGEVDRLLKEDVPAARPPGRPASMERGTFNVGRSDTAEKVTARLKRDDPELAQRVTSGELSANAAARVKGWRPPRVELRSPASVAVRIRQHFTTEQVAELRELLLD